MPRLGGTSVAFLVLIFCDGSSKILVVVGDGACQPASQVSKSASESGKLFTISSPTALQTGLSVDSVLQANSSLQDG